MLTRLVVIIIITGMVYIGFEWGVVYTINHEMKKDSNRYDELLEEIKWWKKQTHDTLAEVNDWKDKFSEMQHMYNKERNKVFELEQKIDGNSGRYLKKNDKTKKAELEENKELVIKCYKQGMTMEQLAQNFNCSSVTIKRALKSWNVNRRCRSRS